MTIQITERAVTPTQDCLVYHPLTVAIGMCRHPRREGDQVIAINAVRHALTQTGLAPVATPDP